MLYQIGTYYLGIADYQKAEYYIDKALVYYPDYMLFNVHKSHLYRVTGQFDKLYGTAQRSMEEAPHEIGHLDMGIYYLLVKEYEESIKYFSQYEAAMGREHNDHMYGYALLKAGYQKKAKEKFELVLEQLPQVTWAYYQYAKTYSAMGMIDSAYYYLEKAVAEPPLWGMSDFMERDPLFESIKDEPEFQRLVGIAREKVRLRREEVRELEKSGAIPASLDNIELY